MRTIAAVRQAVQQADKEAAAGSGNASAGVSATGSMQRRLVRSQLCDSARGFVIGGGTNGGGRQGGSGAGGTLTWQLGQRIGRGAFAEVLAGRKAS